eukprot:TRINITY_DN393_c1_g1_i2.p2 TRINITY_DN393_c1_g1~~TRINITY_DN393_c1_g1_i2.p2  ORF type:complete len:168 (-),score=19.03 TRINITY_DN393_c1_g1_i2:66-569(-)
MSCSTKVFVKMSTLLMVACLVLSKCDYTRKEDIEKKYKTVLWAEEIDTLDYLDGLESLFSLDVFDWLQESLVDILGSLPTSLVEDLGNDPISVIINLVKDQGVMDLGVGVTLTGGIATYRCFGCTDNCCFYDCGKWIPCTGCSKSKCGETCVQLPNSHQPYIAIGEL